MLLACIFHPFLFFCLVVLLPLSYSGLVVLQWPEIHTAAEYGEVAHIVRARVTEMLRHSDRATHSVHESYYMHGRAHF